MRRRGLGRERVGDELEEKEAEDELELEVGVEGVRESELAGERVEEDEKVPVVRVVAEGALPSLQLAREATRRVFVGRVTKMVDLLWCKSGSKGVQGSSVAVLLSSSAFSTSDSTPCARESVELDSEGKEVDTQSTAEGVRTRQ